MTIVKNFVGHMPDRCHSTGRGWIGNAQRAHANERSANSFDRTFIARLRQLANPKLLVQGERAYNFGTRTAWHVMEQ
jgi:hypothetical protein